MTLLEVTIAMVRVSTALVASANAFLASVAAALDSMQIQVVINHLRSNREIGRLVTQRSRR